LIPKDHQSKSSNQRQCITGCVPVVILGLSGLNHSFLRYTLFLAGVLEVMHLLWRDACLFFFHLLLRSCIRRRGWLITVLFRLLTFHPNTTPDTRTTEFIRLSRCIADQVNGRLDSSVNHHGRCGFQFSGCSSFRVKRWLNPRRGES